MENLIKDVKIINFDNVIENADIKILDGRIKEIIPKDGVSASTLIPGFIDVHTHGAMNIDVMEGKEAIESISKHIVQFGTTSFIPTLMTAPKEEILTSLQEGSKVESKGSKIIGLHIEGPWISQEKKGAHIGALLYKPTIQDVQEFQKAANGKLVRIDFAPEVCDMEVIQEMTKQNIVAVVGHTNATFEETNKAFESGASSSTHTWNAMSGISGRQPGAIMASLTNKKCFAEIIPDFVHLSKEIVRFSIKTAGIENIIIVTDSIRPAGMPNGEYVSGGQAVIKEDLKITLKKAGNIAGGASMMIDLFKNLLSMGYSPSEVVRMTSYNAAVNHKLENDRAYIKEGFAADFVILNNDLSKIENVFIDGIKMIVKN